MIAEPISPGTQTRNEQPLYAQPLSPIVRIVLKQVAILRIRSQITVAKFENQLQRLSEEELEPNGLMLLERDLDCGSIRFIVKAKSSGRVCDLIEIAPEDIPAEGIYRSDPM